MDNICELLNAKLKEIENKNCLTNKIKNQKKLFEKHGINIPLAKIEESVMNEEYPEMANKILQETEEILKNKK